MIQSAICLGRCDDVAIVLASVKPGDTVRLVGQSGAVVATTPIKIYHKIAVRNLPCGARVMRGGICIGEATQDIPRAAHVHVHNLRSLRAIRENRETA